MGCDGCPLKDRINSPISAPAKSIHDPIQFPLVTTSDSALPKLPIPFNWSKTHQLVHTTEDSDGNKTHLIISEHPIYLCGVQTGELDNGVFSYRFKKFLPQEGWSDILIDARALHGNGGIADMFGKGAVIHEPKQFLLYARNAVNDFHKDTETHVRYDQFGWKNDDRSFLYGRHLYTPVGPVEAIGAKEVEIRGQWVGANKTGNVQAWTEAADSLFAADMEAYSTMVLASFAAPLMRFQSADEGGAILHLFTPGSGQGKTTALTGAWTVWGKKEGLSLTNEDTRVSKPIAIGTLANLPVIYDELRDKDPEVIRRMVVMFTEGRDRMRGMVDGTIRHTKANWQTIMLSAANNSLIDQLQGDGVDAPAFRVLELSSTLPVGIDKTKGDRLKRIMNENHGHAGDVYLRYLVQPEVMAWTKAALERWTDDIWKVTRLGSEHRFRVRAVGAIAVASALVNKLGILHFNTDRIIQWLVNELGTGKNEGMITARLPIEVAISAFGEFINEHYGEMLVVPDKFKAKGPKMVPLLRPHIRLSMRFEISTQRLFVSQALFYDWAIRKQMSPRLLISQLLENRVLIEQKRQVTLSAGTDIPGAQVQCLEANTQHPVMSGIVASVSELQPDSMVARL